MALQRKAETNVRGDVPTAIVVAIVGLLCALFLPLASPDKRYPTELPPLEYNPAEVERAHEADRNVHVINATGDILATWSILASAHAAQDPHRVAEAQERFAEVLAEGTQGDPDAITGVRAEARRSFLHDLVVPGMPLTVVATRHGLAGPHTPPYVDRAVRIAWFDFRWERLSLLTPERGELEPTLDTLSKIPVAERRALVAWGLAARCNELVGGPEALRPGDPIRCARLRRESITAARALERTYPEGEARAAVDVMEALGEEELADRLETLADVGDSGSLRAVALGDAQSALVRAQSGYATLLRAHRSHRIESYLRGVVAELEHSEP